MTSLKLCGILCLWEASHTPANSLDQVAVNLPDYLISDNRGREVTDQPIDVNGPTAYFTTLPVRLMLNRLLERGIPAELSLSAGTYLCNQIFYAVLDHLTLNNLSIPVGFVHVPALPKQASSAGTPFPSKSFETSLKGIPLTIEVIGEWISHGNI